MRNAYLQLSIELGHNRRNVGASDLISKLKEFTSQNLKPETLACETWGIDLAAYPSQVAHVNGAVYSSCWEMTMKLGSKDCSYWDLEKTV